MTILIDSDILIEVSRARDLDILSKWQALGLSDNVLAYSPVSMAELWHGARPQEFQALEALFDALACVDVNAEIGRKAGDYLRLYRKSHGLALGDAVIGASAVVREAALWTRNRRHYPMQEVRFW